jgi:probable rRNA maturation factor
VPVRNQCRGLRIESAAIGRLIHALDASGRFRVRAGELSIAILDAKSMAELHAKFLADPSPTDVITFEGDPLLGTAGEICVCAEVAREFAQAHGKDFAAELTLYIAHGYLHLAGFDDTTPAARKRMRAAEREAMAVLGTTGSIPVAAM